MRHKEGNTGSFFYIISLFGDGGGEGAPPRKLAPGDGSDVNISLAFWSEKQASPRKIHKSLYAKSSILLHLSSQNVKWAVTFGHHLTKNVYSLFRCGARFLRLGDMICD